MANSVSRHRKMKQKKKIAIKFDIVCTWNELRRLNRSYRIDKYFRRFPQTTVFFIIFFPVNRGLTGDYEETPKNMIKTIAKQMFAMGK